VHERFQQTARIVVCPSSSAFANGWGVVFALFPSGTYTVLYSFSSLPSCADGSIPEGNLVALFPGNLYGQQLRAEQGIQAQRTS
jgi:hypothetical protein